MLLRGIAAYSTEHDPQNVINRLTYGSTVDSISLKDTYITNNIWKTITFLSPAAQSLLSSCREYH